MRFEEYYDQLYTTTLEADEFKKTREYRKLSPRMKKAVDDIFKKMDAKPSNFLNTFEKTISDVSKKYKVKEKDLLQYFEKEAIGLLR